MVVDQEYINHLKEDMENQIEQVRFELAWLVEFHERGLQKLKDYYLQQVDFERIEVLGFQSDHRVSTFRCAKMSSELQANLARLHELIFAAGEGDGDEEDDDGDDGLGFDGRSTLRGHKTDFGFDGTDNAGSQNTEKPLSSTAQVRSNVNCGGSKGCSGRRRCKSWNAPSHPSPMRRLKMWKPLPMQRPPWATTC